MLAMLVTSSDGVPMRRLCVFVLASFLWVLSSAPGGEGASAIAQIIRPSSIPERQLLLEATFVCGTFERKIWMQVGSRSRDAWEKCHSRRR
jgi:hypothetical protein